MSEIKVDIDDLLDKLEAMREDDYVTAKLTIENDGYSSELVVEAVSFESDTPISYGEVPEASDELM